MGAGEDGHVECDDGAYPGAHMCRDNGFVFISGAKGANARESSALGGGDGAVTQDDDERSGRGQH